MAVERVVLAVPFRLAREAVVASPFQFALTSDHALRVVSFNSLTGVRVALQGQRLNERGDLVPFGFEHTPNTDRTVRTQDFAIGAGFLVNLAVFASAGAPRIGQTFVQVEVIRGLGGATYVLGPLLQGYVTGTQKLGWPGSPIQRSTEAGNFARTIEGTGPPAGVEVSETVPTGARWRILMIQVELTTSAVAGSRFPSIRFVDTNGTSPMFRFGSSHGQGPSTQEQFYFCPGTPFAADQGPNVTAQGLPNDSVLTAGQSWGTITGGFQAGDRYGLSDFVVEELIEAN